MDSLIPKNKREAKRLGILFYKTGKPCKSGNFELRKTNGQCTCQDCVTRIKNLNKQLNIKNFAKYKAKHQKWLEKNKESVAQKQKEWKAKNIKRYKEVNKKWKLENQPKIQKHRHQRRVVKQRGFQAKPTEFDSFVFEEAANLARKRKTVFNFDWHIDHLIPLQAKNVCGLHCGDNIQVIPKVLNLNKSNKMIYTKPFEWLQQNG